MVRPSKTKTKCFLTQDGPHLLSSEYKYITSQLTYVCFTEDFGWVTVTLAYRETRAG